MSRTAPERASGGSALAHAAIFGALGDNTRLSIVRRLSAGRPCSITRLAGETHLTRQAVTKHLRVLQQAGLVRCARIGRESRFSLDPRPIDLARSYLELVCAQWDAALGRLRAFVER